MKRLLSLLVGLSVGLGLAGSVHAYTETGQKVTIPVGATGTINGSSSLSTSIVQQGTADVPGTLDFGSGGNDFRDSGAAIKIDVDTNLAGNRVIIYTNNLGSEASPAACLDTSKGIDGGGLVGADDCSKTVPLVWALGVNNISPTGDPAIFTADSANVDYTFAADPSGPGATNAVFVTDKAHVATFTTKDSVLDNQAMKFCDGGASVPNAASDGLYPQFFGEPGVNKDLCDDATNVKIDEAEELVKNIATVAFDILGTKGNLARLDTPAADDVLVVNGPFYLPVAADFRSAPAQAYSTNTLTVELVTQ